jgi:LEA14-like dessication related protein
MLSLEPHMRPLSARIPRCLFHLCVVSLVALGGCAGMFGRDAPHVSVAGIEPIEGQGLEMRFELRLRVQNPNETPLDYDGVALDVELNGMPFASGVSQQRGTVPRFDETVVTVPLTVSVFAAARQAITLPDTIQRGTVRYVVRGKLAGGAFGAVRFTDTGTLDMNPQADPH